MTRAQELRSSLAGTGSFVDFIRRRQPRVPATCVLMAINLAVFLAMIGFGAGLWHAPNGIQLAWGANFGPATQDGQWWRLGSAMFIHFGVLHLAMNMWALWDVGNFVERIYGSARFIALYAASGLVGNLVSLAVQGNRAVSGGASGAIFGLYGALLIALWQERHFLHPREFAWLFWGAAGFAVAVVCFGLLVPGIDNAAHLGGFASGALLGLAFGRPPQHAGPTPRATRAMAGGIVAAAVLICIARLPAPHYLWREETAARREIDRFLRQEATIGREWTDLVMRGKQHELSFAELARRLDGDIAARYERSFDALSSLPVNPEMPSAATVLLLRGYADIRREESHALAEGLRSGDPARFDEARELARQAQEIARRIGPSGPRKN